MYIDIRHDPLRKYEYICLMEKVRSKDGKRWVTRRVETLGRRDLLEKENPNIVAELKEKYKAKGTKAPELASALLSTLLEKEDTKVANLYDRPQPVLNYSFYLVRAVWKKLRLNEVVANYLRGTKLKADVERLLQYLIASKLVAPDSNIRTLDHIATWAGVGSQVHAKDDIYKALRFMDTIKDKLCARINGTLYKNYGRDLSVVFYDVTNTWFETPYDDDEQAQIACARDFNSSSYEMQKEGVVSGREIKRKRGKSKEGRQDPILSIGLLIDSDGIPVDWRVYSGNASEKKEFLPTVNQMREKYNIGKTCVVADRGLNSFENIMGLKQQQDNFLVAQSIHQLDRETFEKVIRKDDWKIDKARGMYLKEVPYVKRYRGKEIKCRLIVNITEARMRRELEAFRRNYDKALEAVNKEHTDPRSKKKWETLLKTEEGSVLGLNERKIREELESCGIYGIVTTIPAPGDPSAQPQETLSASAVIDKYRKLVGIEDCFRIMKSKIELRPVRVWTEESIRGHVGVCVMALIVARFISNMLARQGTTRTMDQIFEAFKFAQISVNPKVRGQTIYRRVLVPGSKLCDEIRKTGKPTKDDPDDIDLIMDAVGLKRLPVWTTRQTLATCLGTKFPSDDDVWAP